LHRDFTLFYPCRDLPFLGEPAATFCFFFSDRPDFENFPSEEKNKSTSFPRKGLRPAPGQEYKSSSPSKESFLPSVEDSPPLRYGSPLPPPSFAMTRAFFPRSALFSFFFSKLLLPPSFRRPARWTLAIDPPFFESAHLPDNFVPPLFENSPLTPAALTIHSISTPPSLRRLSLRRPTRCSSPSGIFTRSPAETDPSKFAFSDPRRRSFL